MTIMFNALLNLYTDWNRHRFERKVHKSVLIEQYRNYIEHANLQGIRDMMVDKRNHGLGLEMEAFFVTACSCGQLEIAQYFLFSSEIKEAGYRNPKVDTQDNMALIAAAEHGKIEIVKYLLTSPEILNPLHAWPNIHAQKDRAFKQACVNGHLEVLKFLIVDMGLEQTTHIDDFLKHSDYSAAQYAKQLFDKSLLHTHLQEALAVADCTEPSRRKNKL